MPHIIYRGKAELAAAYEGFEPARRDVNGWIMKILQAYLANDRQTLLFDCTAVRSGFSQNFYVRAEQKGASVTIRVDPYTNVEKNEGVKRTLVAVRDLIVAFSAQLSFDKSNLPPEYLAAPSEEKRD